MKQNKSSIKSRETKVRDFQIDSNLKICSNMFKFFEYLTKNFISFEAKRLYKTTTILIYYFIIT